MYQKKFLYIAIGMIVMMLPLILDLSGMNISTPWNIHLWAFLLGLFGLGWCLGAYFYVPETKIQLDFHNLVEKQGRDFKIISFIDDGNSSFGLFIIEIDQNEKRNCLVYSRFPTAEAVWAKELIGQTFFVKDSKMYPKK